MRRFLATVFVVLSALCLMIASKLCAEAVTDITKGVGNPAMERAQENAREKLKRIERDPQKSPRLWKDDEKYGSDT